MLHGGYFPEAAERIDLLRRINAAIKPGGIMSCYLTHLKRYGLTLRQVQNEIRRAGFRLQSRARHRLVHDDDLEGDGCFNTKKSALGFRAFQDILFRHSLRLMRTNADSTQQVCPLFLHF